MPIRLSLIILALLSTAYAQDAERYKATIWEHLSLFAGGPDLSSPTFWYPNSMVVRDWLERHCYVTSAQATVGDALTVASQQALNDFGKVATRCVQ